MLVLSRKLGEKIVVGDGITITVVDINRGKVKIGVTAPKSTPVHRQEVADALKREDAANRREDELPPVLSIGSDAGREMHNDHGPW